MAALRGLGRSVVPMIVALLGVCGFRLVWIAVLHAADLLQNIEMLYVAYPLSWGMTFAAHTICFLIIRSGLKKKWGA